MTTTIKKSGTLRESIYECEVKRRRLSGRPGKYESFWKVKSVTEALEDKDTEFRCKDCGGQVRVHRKRVEHGPEAHVEHILHRDSEYCPSGMHFMQATDGRSPRRAEAQVR